MKYTIAGCITKYGIEDIKPYIDNLVNRFNIKKEAWNKAAKDKPTLYEYLKKNIYKSNHI
jgi:hypothetical protein